MPWKTIEDVPKNIRKHNGIDLTLFQANFWANIYDGVLGAKSDTDSKNKAAAIAWSKFTNKYKIQNGVWKEKETKTGKGFIMETQKLKENLDALRKCHVDMKDLIGKSVITINGEIKYSKEDFDSLGKMIKNLEEELEKLDDAEGIKKAEITATSDNVTTTEQSQIKPFSDRVSEYKNRQELNDILWRFQDFVSEVYDAKDKTEGLDTTKLIKDALSTIASKFSELGFGETMKIEDEINMIKNLIEEKLKKEKEEEDKKE